MNADGGRSPSGYAPRNREEEYMRRAPGRRPIPQQVPRRQQHQPSRQGYDMEGHYNDRYARPKQRSPTHHLDLASGHQQQNRYNEGDMLQPPSSQEQYFDRPSSAPPESDRRVRPQGARPPPPPIDLHATSGKQQQQQQQWSNGVGPPPTHMDPSPIIQSREEWDADQQVYANIAQTATVDGGGGDDVLDSYYGAPSPRKVTPTRSEDDSTQPYEPPNRQKLHQNIVYPTARTQHQQVQPPPLPYPPDKPQLRGHPPMVRAGVAGPRAMAPPPINTQVHFPNGRNQYSVPPPLNTSSSVPVNLYSSSAPLHSPLDNRPPSAPPPIPVPKPFTLASLEEARTFARHQPDNLGFQMDYAFALTKASRLFGKSGSQAAISKFATWNAEGHKVLKNLIAQHPSPQTSFLMATCLAEGLLNFPEDYDKAYSAFQSAAKAGHVEAMYRIAMCAELGIGTKRDAQRAFQFYRKAATAGSTGGCFKLGVWNSIFFTLLTF